MRGVGPWSAQMFLLHSLRRPDVFPAADVGLQRAAQSASASTGGRAPPSSRPAPSLASLPFLRCRSCLGARRPDTRPRSMTMQLTIVLVHGAYADSSSWNGHRAAPGGRPPRDRRGPTRCAASPPTPRTLTDLVRSLDGPVRARRPLLRRRGHDQRRSRRRRRRRARLRRRASRSRPARAPAMRRRSSPGRRSPTRSSGPARRRRHRHLHRPGRVPHQFAADLPEVETRHGRHPAAGHRGARCSSRQAIAALAQPCRGGSSSASSTTTSPPARTA